MRIAGCSGFGRERGAEPSSAVNAGFDLSGCWVVVSICLIRSAVGIRMIEQVAV